MAIKKKNSKLPGIAAIALAALIIGTAFYLLFWPSITAPKIPKISHDEVIEKIMNCEIKLISTNADYIEILTKDGATYRTTDRSGDWEEIRAALDDVKDKCPVGEIV